MTERDLFIAALQLEPSERPGLFDRECADDPGLRQRVERLLAAHAGAASAFGPELGTVDYETAPSAAPVNDITGMVIDGRYKLLEEIGEGGMGNVWMSEQREPVKRLVAVKLIKAGMDSKAVLARFEAERQALAMMDHPNIAKVLDAGTTAELRISDRGSRIEGTNDPQTEIRNPQFFAGRPYFVMELVKGLPLTEYCDNRRLSVRDRLGLFVQICSAVQHAHQKGVIHRDLKPSNVLVTEHDGKPVPKVIDFGLAKALHSSRMLTERTLHTAYGTVVGTPMYMAPEQVGINALDVDTRGDIYSLGVVLYELLTGTTPLEKKRFKEAAWEEVKRLIREEEPPRPSTRLSASDALPSLAANRQIEPAGLSRLVRGELDWIVLKALEKDRNRRYETANGFASDVQRFLSGEPVLAVPPSAGYRLRKFFRKHRGPVTAAAVLFATLVAGVVGTTVGLVEARKQRDAARQAESVADDRRREVESTAAGLRVDLDLAELPHDPPYALLLLARTLRGLPADLGDLREFVAAVILYSGQDYARLLPPITHDGNAVVYLSVSPDGQTLLTRGEDFTARLWDVRTSRPIAVLRKGNERVVNCGFSPDGRTVFTDDLSGVARFWDAPGGAFRAQTEPRESRYIYSEEPHASMRYYSPGAAQISGGRLLTKRLFAKGETYDWHWEGPVELWDTATGRFIARLDEPSRNVENFHFLGGGRWITTEEGGSVVLVLSADDGRLLARLGDPAAERVQHVEVSPTGRRVAVTYWDKTSKIILRMWDTDGWRAEPVAVHDESDAPQFQFLTDDAFALFGRVIDEECLPWGVFRCGKAEPIARFNGYGPDGPLMGELVPLGGGRLFDAQNGRRLRAPAGRKFHPDLARFAADGRFVVVARDDPGNGEKVMIDTRTEKQISMETQYPYGSWMINLPGFGMVTAVARLGRAEVWLIPPSARLDLPPDLLELWAQVAVRGEIGPEGTFAKWKEATWERKRQELAARPAPWPDFPFPGRVAADHQHWLRSEFENADETDKPGFARQLLERAEAAGDTAEATWWRTILKPKANPPAEPDAK